MLREGRPDLLLLGGAAVHGCESCSVLIPALAGEVFFRRGSMFSQRAHFPILGTQLGTQLGPKNVKVLSRRSLWLPSALLG